MHRVFAVDEEREEVPSLKRKKTVTWADGRSIQDDQVEGEKAINPALKSTFDHQTEGTAQENIFVPDGRVSFHLRDAVGCAGQWSELESSNERSLSAEDLAKRRLERCEQLVQVYEDEFWSLADELLLRHYRTLQKSKQDAPLSNDCETMSDDLIEDKPQGWIVKDAWRNSDSIVNDNENREHVPTPEEIEELILTKTNTLEESHFSLEALEDRVIYHRKEYVGNLPKIGRLETSAGSMISRELDALGAIAMLCGRSGRHLIMRSAVTLGRRVQKDNAGTVTKGEKEDEQMIDIDMATEVDEKNSGSISRIQARIILEGDGTFVIHCLGKRTMMVNGERLTEGQSAKLHHMSLMRAGPATFFFLANRAAVDRLLRRSGQLDVA